MPQILFGRKQTKSSSKDASVDSDAAASSGIAGLGLDVSMEESEASVVQKVLEYIIPTGNEASVVLPATAQVSLPKTPKRNILCGKFNEFNDESFVANCRKKETTTAAASSMVVAPPTQFLYGYNYSAFYPPEMMWQQPGMQVPQLPPRDYNMMPMPAPPGWHSHHMKSFHNSNDSTASTNDTSIGYSTTTGESSCGSSCLTNDLFLTNDLVKYVEQTFDEFTEGISDIIVGCSDAICDCSKKGSVRNDDETMSTTWAANRQGGSTTSITPTKLKAELVAKIKQLESIVNEKNNKSLESITEVSSPSCRDDATQTKEEEDLRSVHYNHKEKENVNYFPTLFTVNDDDDAVEEDLEVKYITAAKAKLTSDRRSKSRDRLKKFVDGANPFKTSTTNQITACTKETEIVANISGNITSAPVEVLPSSSETEATPDLSISSNKKLDPIDFRLLRSSSEKMMPILLSSNNNFDPIELLLSSSEKMMPNLIDSPVSVDDTASLDNQQSSTRFIMDYPLELSRTQAEC